MAALIALFIVKAVQGELTTEWKKYLIIALIAIITETLIFWDGIIRVYLTSRQLGIKWRVIGIICGWLPIINLIALGKIISVASREVKTENNRQLLNEKRKNQQICATKYPILLVHGVFFRDFRYFNY